MKTKLTILLIFVINSIFSQINLQTTTINETTIATNLEIPWDMTYGSDGWIWFTELSGKISRLNPDTHELQLIFTVPDVEVFGFSAGMHSIVLHPDFLIIPDVYVHYLNSTTTSKIVKYTYDITTNTLINPILILDNIPGGLSHNGSRMFINNNLLFISLGDSYGNPSLAQDLTSNAGKILRMNLDGSVPSDNPISGSLIYSFGHRNPQGMCTGNGFIYSSEHGTSNDDEINIIQENRNFGWTEVEGYCDLPNEIIFCNANNVAEPIYTWSPSIAPCGMDYYNNSAIPEWQNSLLLAVLKDKKLIQLKLNVTGDSIIEENSYLINTYGRLRDVLVIPDGRIFICTTNHDFFGNPIATDDRIIELKADTTNSILEEELLRVTIYPNPSTGNFTIQRKSSDLMQISIYNFLGKMIKKENNIETLNHELKLTNFENGIYFLSIKINGKKMTKKIVIYK